MAGQKVRFVELLPDPPLKRCPKWWCVYGVSEDRDVFAAAPLLGSDAYLCSLIDGSGCVLYRKKVYLSLDWAIAEYGSAEKQDLFRKLKAKVLAGYDEAVAAEVTPSDS